MRHTLKLTLNRFLVLIALALSVWLVPNVIYAVLDSLHSTFYVQNNTLGTIYIAYQTHEQATCGEFNFPTRLSEPQWHAVASKDKFQMTSNQGSSIYKESCARVYVAVPSDTSNTPQQLASIQYHCSHTAFSPYGITCDVNELNKAGAALGHSITPSGGQGWATITIE